MPRGNRHRGWWALGLVAFVCVFFVGTGLLFSGTLVPSVRVTVTADRAGLVMEPGAKVKMRGLQVGKVTTADARPDGATLRLELRPDLIEYIPANVKARIRTTTIFGAKFVDLVFPENPDTNRLRAGAVIPALNVTTEVNTVFENLTTVLAQVQPDKLNAVMTTLADAMRGKGSRLGQANADAGEVVSALNDRTDTLRRDLNALAGVSNTYAEAAGNLIETLAAATTTSTTITDQADDLQAALLGAIGLANSGTDLLSSSKDDMVNAFNKLPAATGLLHKYDPSYTCLLQGVHWFLTEGTGMETNGYSAVTDSSLLSLPQDPYRYPDDLPIIAAKGGPDGKPGCGSLPRVDQNMPVRYLVTNTGFGTGLDVRPNPGIAHPWLVNFFPTTKAVPEPPKIYGAGPPAIGPVPYPGAPPYGAPLFGPDGTPLWAPPPPGAPPPPVPGVPLPPPPYGPGPGPQAPQPSPVVDPAQDGGGP